MPEGEGEGAHPYSVQTGMVFRGGGRGHTLIRSKRVWFSGEGGVQVHYLPSSTGYLFGPEIFNPLSPNSVQDQFSPYNYPYTVQKISYENQ